MEILIFFAVIWAIVKYSQASEAKKKEYRAKLQKAYDRMREEAQKNARTAPQPKTPPTRYTSSSPSPAPTNGTFEYGTNYEQARRDERIRKRAASHENRFEPVNAEPKRHNNSEYILHHTNHEKCVSRNNDTPTVVRPMRFWGNADFD